jgi:hypothetical protein
VPTEADSEFLGNPDEHSIAMLTSRTGNDSPAPSRFTKDAMKRTKRLLIELQHREVSITVTGPALHVQDSEPGTPNPPTVCPACGSPWITIVAQVDGDARANTDRIHRALEQFGLHLQVSPAGQLRICQKSFEELKEKL